jgi:hypothetical protein
MRRLSSSLRILRRTSTQQYVGLLPLSKHRSSQATRAPLEEEEEEELGEQAMETLEVVLVWIRTS